MVRHSDFSLKIANEVVYSPGEQEEALQLPEMGFWSTGWK
jgi:hypothetical protein